MADRDSRDGSQRAAPLDQGANQATGPRCECSQPSLAPPGSAPALDSALKPCPACKASSHWAASLGKKKVVFSNVLEIQHEAGYSAFTYHVQENEASKLFVGLGEERPPSEGRI